MPSRFGPRHWGQSAARPGPALKQRAADSERRTREVTFPERLTTRRPSGYRQDQRLLPSHAGGKQHLPVIAEGDSERAAVEVAVGRAAISWVRPTIARCRAARSAGRGTPGAGWTASAGRWAAIA